jgi:hypothetical protein
MKIKVSELSGAALDWAVAKCEGRGFVFGVTDYAEDGNAYQRGTAQEAGPHYSTNWAHGGPIIEQEQISVIQLERESIPDAQGFWQGKYQAQWGAVIGESHNLEENYGSQGDYWGKYYNVDREAVIGGGPLIAAMRCYVASKLGLEVDVPDELI